MNHGLIVRFYELLYSSPQSEEAFNAEAFRLLDDYPELAKTRFPEFFPCNDGTTPLHIAAGQMNCDLIRRLIALGAEVNATDIEKTSPLYEAIRGLRGFWPEEEQRQLQAVEILLGAGADPNYRNEHDLTVFFDAIRYTPAVTYTEMIRLFLRYGAAPNVVCAKAWTPLSMMAYDPEAFAAVLAYGADVNYPNDYGMTPLMYSQIGCEKLTALLRSGANLHARDKTRKTALHYFAAGTDDSWRETEAKESEPARLKALECLLQAGSKPNARDRYGYTPLHYAAKSCHVAKARILLAYGADLRACNHAQQTPLALVKSRRLKTNIPWERGGTRWPHTFEHARMEDFLAANGAATD